ncbi:ribonuclease h [Olea europaea subsp. europaea]|uniref:Ribonuclease h n=1 Tax=Olea europaea subsp. europaea TaxID=158383 RepID=A0A8S0Q475_OLEEU|nr:ribonuclease h [Olea europaea subsp. europaea]
MVVPQLVSWKRPGSGTMKLNVDGGSNGNSDALGGGGLIQDSRGKLIFGFVHYYGVATNIVVEFHILKNGLAMCKEQGFWGGIRFYTDGEMSTGWKMHFRVFVGGYMCLD